MGVGGGRGNREVSNVITKIVLTVPFEYWGTSGKVAERLD